MIEESRQKGGTLTLDAQPFAKQMTEVTLTPAVRTEGEALETLSGDTKSPDELTDWTLDMGAVQDFLDPAGFVAFANANAGDEVAFEWKPNADATSPTYTGVVKVRAVQVGGAVNARLSSSTSWPVTGQPTTTYPAP